MDTSAPADTAVTVKSFVPMPVAVVTIIFPNPAGAAAGTDVVMDVALIAVMLAATPPMVTVAPVNPVPVIVMTVPAGPEIAVAVLITGAGAAGAPVTRKEPVPGGPTLVVTTKPALLFAGAAIGTVRAIRERLLVTTGAFNPPMVTVAPVRFRPRMTTVSPGAPLLGVMLRIPGELAGCTAVTVKGKLASWEAAVVTAMPPEAPATASGGTLVTICVPLLLEMVAVFPAMVTVAPLRFAP